MSKYNFDELVDRKNTGSYKWNIIKENELPMWVADMDFHVLPEIKDAIIDRIEIDSYGYCECPEEYFESYKNWFKRNHDLDLDTRCMAFSIGVVASIDSILKHLVPPHSNVVIQSPVYHVFYHCIKNNGHIVKENKLIDKDNYQIDFNNLESLLSEENTKAMILCNPHNPIGRIWTKEELKRVSDLCNKYDVLLISDEIHCDITEPGIKYNSILSVTDRAIALFAPTKAFNIASIKSSIAYCPDEEVKVKFLKGFGMDDIGEPNYIASAATVAAFTYGDEWNTQMREYIYNNKKYVVDFINKELPMLKVSDMKATYLLWVDISKVANSSDAFMVHLRRQTGLFVSSGKQFGSGGEGHIRINLATSLANVKDACERLKQYILSII